MEFKTVKEQIEVEIVEKKSKFIANLIPVENLEEAEQKIDMIRKKYHDARHNCMAYRIIKDNQIIEKSSDDGEPSGTAGAPMLNILQKNNLVNVVVIVTRYFGGILLGTGGLVRAYSNCLQRAILSCDVIYKCQGLEMLVVMEYSEINEFQYYCKKNQIVISDVEYGQWITCKIELEDDKKEKLWKDFETKSIILKDISVIAKKYITKSK